MNQDREKIKEIAPIIPILLIPLAIDLAMLFIAFWQFKIRAKYDKVLSERVKSLLKDGKDWKVVVIKQKAPNAFCMHNPYIFISTGLIDMLNKRELEAVLLHEAGHISNKDVWKDFLIRHGFAATLFTLISIISKPVAVGVLLLFWYIYQETRIFTVIMARTMGRRQERKADSFTTKYGYGDDLISALTKLQLLYDKQLEKYCKSKACKIAVKLDEITGEHPPLKERIENILKSKELWDNKMKSFVQYRNFFMDKLGVKKEG